MIREWDLREESRSPAELGARIRCQLGSSESRGQSPRPPPQRDGGAARPCCAKGSGAVTMRACSRARSGEQRVPRRFCSSTQARTRIEHKGYGPDTKALIGPAPCRQISTLRTACRIRQSQPAPALIQGQVRGVVVARGADVIGVQSPGSHRQPLVDLERCVPTGAGVLLNELVGEQDSDDNGQFALGRRRSAWYV